MCNKLAGEVRLDGDMLMLRIPAGAAKPMELFTHCEWQWDPRSQMAMRLASTKEVEAEARRRNALLLAKTGIIGSVPTGQPQAETALLEAFARATREPATR